MAIGLTDHVWSYREYIQLQYIRPSPYQQTDKRIARLLTPALQGQPRDRDTSTSCRDGRSTRKRSSLSAHRRKLREVPVIVLQDYRKSYFSSSICEMHSMLNYRLMAHCD